mmetsp:Transcript_11563/g.17452  ORF Transcript_11563/g.17452 Transcript_11563/m.17452 type:complete len:82 (-) Transcript_11563:1587-1832(-)
MENFVKFFREKYRLCWKEIYLKFKALLPLPERCKTCLQWFTFSHMGECQSSIDPSGDSLTNLSKVRFHDVDVSQQILPNSN